MFKKRKKLKIILLAFFLIGIVSVFFANHYVKKYGYRNLIHFISTYSSNKSLAADAKFETLEINIDPADFETLETERDNALKRGILIKEGDTYVKAKLKHKGKKIKAQLRLKGHMTDHLQDKKWSFRIKTKGNDAFMGMKVFSIQHPGTRNYIYEWIYHQMMKQEGIIALNYDFIKVMVNGEDWGIYAVEEHFAQELVERNQRPKGPLLRFNPDMYWNARIAEHDKLSYKMDNATFQSSFLEPYDDKNTFKDSTILNGYKHAAALMEQFRNGNLSTSKVFDIKKLATFHAIIDLVGGHRSLDWSDVKYYYNSQTNKIEPVAYESFSVQPTYSICGSNNFSNDKEVSKTSFHTELFSDPEFYRLYLKELERIASKKWLQKFLKKNDRALENKLAIVYTDYAYKDYTPEPYFNNVKLIDKILNPSQGIHAYVNSISNDSLFLGVTGIDALPVELKKIKIDTTTLTLVPQIISAKFKNTPLKYESVSVKLPSGLVNKIASTSKIKLVYSLPGMNKEIETKVLPISTSLFSTADLSALVQSNSNLSTFNFLTINQINKSIQFNSSKIVLDRNLIIPAGFVVNIMPGTQIDFVKSSKIISRSPVFVYGSVDVPVVFTSTDHTGEGLSLINIDRESVFNYLQANSIGTAKAEFKNSAVISSYESPVKLTNCTFSQNNFNDVRLIRSTISISNSLFGSTANDAVVLYYSNAEITNSEFMNGGNDGVDASGSVVKISNCRFSSFKSAAISFTNGVECKLLRVKIDNSAIGIEASNNSQLSGDNLELTNCKIGLKANQKGDVFGPSKISMRNLKDSGNKILKEVEKGSDIDIIK